MHVSPERISKILVDPQIPIAKTAVETAPLARASVERGDRDEPIEVVVETVADLGNWHGARPRLPHFDIDPGTCPAPHHERKHHRDPNTPT